MPIPWIAIAVTIALNVAAYLITPKPKTPKPAAAQDLEAPTAEAGRPIPVVFGTKKVASPNVLWFGEISKTSYEVKV